MKFDIEMLSVDKADAIILRHFDERGKEIVILIDAGKKKHGPKVVEHINKWTEKKRIDLAISTHLDSDHIGGFIEVVNNIEIDKFWIHDPRKHIQAVEKLRHPKIIDKILSEASEEPTVRYVLESLRQSVSLHDLLDKKTEIKKIEPFEGIEYEKAPLKVLGPTEQEYERLLSKFRNVDEFLTEQSESKTKLFSKRHKTDEEIVDEENDKTKENLSSTILLYEPGDGKYLFASDANPDALMKAHKKYNLEKLKWLSLPHHGSKYSITSELIKIFSPKNAYVSADGTEKYPSQAVVNLLKKTDTKVYSTHTGAKRLKKGLPSRPGYKPATPL